MQKRGILRNMMAMLGLALLSAHSPGASAPASEVPPKKKNDRPAWEVYQRKRWLHLIACRDGVRAYTAGGVRVVARTAKSAVIKLMRLGVSEADIATTDITWPA